MTRPLEGLRVLDLSHFIAGPFCSMQLADSGAEVIKVEPPEGESCRKIGPFVKENSLYFSSYNRNKLAITLNLRNPRGVDLFKQLVSKADVIIENFRPGTLEKYGCGYSELSKINPGLIMTTITGFGEYSSLSQKSAFDMTVQAMSGLMYLSGTSDMPPLKIGAPIGDYTSAFYATIAILTALQYRAKTGRGQQIDISIFDSLFSIQEYHPYRYLHTGIIPPRVGNRRITSAPSNMYKTKDGYIYITCGNDSLWKRLALLIGKPELIDNPKFRTSTDRVNNTEELDEIVSEWIKEGDYDTNHLEKILDEDGIPCGPVLNIGQTANLPIVKERELIIELEDSDVGKIYVPGSVIKFSDSPIAITRKVPRLGEHNQEIYCGLLGYPESLLEELKQQSVI